MGRALPIAVLALLVLAGDARAQAWPAPAEVATSSAYILGPSLGIDAGGRALVGWTMPADPNDAGSPRRSTGLRAVSPSGALESPRVVPDGLVSAPALFGADGVAVVRQRLSCTGIPANECRLDSRIHVRLTAAFGRTGGALGPARTIDSFDSFGAAPALAGNALGQMALVYSERRRGGGVVWVAERLPGRASFGPPRALARGRGIGQVAVAVGQRGHVLVAYARGGRVMARTRHPGHGFKRADDIASAGRRVVLRASVAPDALAAVALQRDHVGRGPGLPPVTTVVRVATRPPGAPRFGEPQLLGSLGTGGSSPPPRLAPAPDGSVLVASVTGLGRVARTAGTLERLEVGQSADDVAVRDDGTAMIVGRALSAAGALLAAYAPPGGAFGPSERIAMQAGSSPVAAFDQRTGRPTVAWLTSAPAPLRVALLVATRGCADSDCG